MRSWRNCLFTAAATSPAALTRDFEKGGRAIFVRPSEQGMPSADDQELAGVDNDEREQFSRQRFRV
jgi:hypothetical protein